MQILEEQCTRWMKQWCKGPEVESVWSMKRTVRGGLSGRSKVSRRESTGAALGVGWREHTHTHTPLLLRQTERR
jgi:hypothetical protein